LSGNCLFDTFLKKSTKDCPLPQNSKSVETFQTFSVRHSLSKSGQSAVDFTNLSCCTFARHCLQRGGGLAQWRGTLSVMRGTNVQVHTKRSAELHPPLCQTACCALAFFREFSLSFPLNCRTVISSL